MKFKKIIYQLQYGKQIGSVMGLEARFFQGMCKRRTGPVALGDGIHLTWIGIHLTWIWRGEEGEESRLPPEFFPRTTVLMGKAMAGPLWEGRCHDLLFVQKLEMPL